MYLSRLLFDVNKRLKLNRLNNNNKNYENYGSNVQASYVALTFGGDQYYSLDINSDRLLIPEKVPSIVEHLYPQSTGDFINNKYAFIRKLR